MQTFQDSHEPPRTWKIRLSLPALRAIKDEAGLDLFSSPDPSDAIKAFWEAGIEQQLDAIDVAIHFEEQEQSFDSIDFAKSLTSENVLDAILAFIGSLADFYPSLRKPIEMISSKARATLREGILTATEKAEEYASQLTLNSNHAGSGSTN